MKNILIAILILNMGSSNSTSKAIYKANSICNANSKCKIYVIDSALRSEYETRMHDHNKRLDESSHPNSGFDILQPSEIILCSENALNNTLPLGIMSAAYDIESGKPMAYYLFARSSINKTPMRVCNDATVIESDYRGELAASVDFVSGCDIESGQSQYHIEIKDRYFQICMGNLMPFYVEIVNNLEDLGMMV